MLCPSCAYDNLPGADQCEQCGISLTHEDIPSDDRADANTPIERHLIDDTVAHLEPSRPVSVGTTTTLAETVRIMRNKCIGCILVTDADGKLAGLLSERDVLNKLALEPDGLDHRAVETLMTPSPETAQLEYPIAHAIHRMIIGDHRHLPLVDAEGRPTGIVSLRDIVNYVAARFPQVVL